MPPTKMMKRVTMKRAQNVVLKLFFLIFFLASIFGVLVAYQSPFVGYGHPFYRLKQNLEIWQLRFTHDPSNRIHLKRRLIHRRMEEIRILAKNRSGISPIFAWIPFAHSAELPPTDPIVETVKEAVILTEELIKEINTLVDHTSKIEAIKTLSGAVTEEVNTLHEIALTVGITDGDVMGGVAEGIREMEEINMETERVQELGVDYVPVTESVLESPAEKDVDVYKIQKKILREQVESEAFLQKLSAEGVHALKAEALSRRLKDLVGESQEFFQSGNFFGAEQRIREADALEQEALHFVESVRELAALQSEAKEELERVHEEYQFFDADLERAKFFPYSTPSQLSAVQGAKTEIQRMHQDAKFSLAQGDGERSRQYAWEIRREMKRAKNLLDELEREAQSFQRDSSSFLIPPETTMDIASVEEPWIEVTEVNTNVGFEIVAKDKNGAIVQHVTKNNHQDRFPDGGRGIGFAVWQTLTSNGWEIQGMKQGQQPFFITVNNVDDTNPKTDGRFVVWQSTIHDRLVVVLFDAKFGVTTQLSAQDLTAIEPHLANGMVTWREWTQNDWVINFFPLPFD